MLSTQPPTMYLASSLAEVYAALRKDADVVHLVGLSKQDLGVAVRLVRETGMRSIIGH